jgi:hypothetical protein
VNAESAVFAILAGAVVLLHLAFVIFVVLGGIAVLRWRRVAWLHVPAAVWGVLVEFAGWICPLTPLEEHLRQRAGMDQYSGDFLTHYVFPLLYPADLTREVQIALGTVALLINAAVYWRVVHTRRLRTVEGHAAPRREDIPAAP